MQTQTNNVIETLQQEAKDNPVANAVFHAWAVRERTRHNVTVEALTATMHKEKYNFTPSQIVPVLDKLSKLGFGKLETVNGKVKALSGVTTTLQSIGAAALGEEMKLKSKAQKHRFHAMAARSETLRVIKEDVRIANALKPTIKVVIEIEGRPIEIPIPADMRSDDITALIKKLRG